MQGNIAAQNQMTLAQLRKQLETEGMSQSQFRNQLRDQILMQRLRERDQTLQQRASELEHEIHERKESEEARQRLADRLRR